MKFCTRIINKKGGGGGGYKSAIAPIKLHIAPVILHNLFSLNPLIPTYCYQEEPLGHSVSPEPKMLFTRHIYIAARLSIMLQASWHIAEGN